MYSFTIDNQEYLAPSGYGEITLAEFTSYMATVAPIKPKMARIEIPAKGILARLAARLRNKAQELRDDRELENMDWIAELEFEASFVAHWLKIEHSVIERMSSQDIAAIYSFLIESWKGWKPVPNPNGFTFQDRTWTIDLSLQTIGSIDLNAGPEQVLARICSCGKLKLKPRDWGGVSLHIAASIMNELAVRHRAMGIVVGKSILESFKIEA